MKVNELIHPDTQLINLENEILVIPSRVYFNEPSPEKEASLTDLQKTILSCLYLRHHNGLVRQKRLELLTDAKQYFTLPYKFHLLGEYVIEILEDLQKHITDETIDNFAKFANDNNAYFQKLESRMTSYWNVYYRWKSYTLKNYIGRKNIDKIKKRTHNIGFCSSGA